MSCPILRLNTVLLGPSLREITGANNLASLILDDLRQNSKGALTVLFSLSVLIGVNIRSVLNSVHTRADTTSTLTDLSSTALTRNIPQVIKDGKTFINLRSLNLESLVEAINLGRQYLVLVVQRFQFFIRRNLKRGLNHFLHLGGNTVNGFVRLKIGRAHV